MSYRRMKQEEERLSKEIETLMEQAEILDREEDEAFGKDNNGYNVQVCVDEEEGIILAGVLTNEAFSMEVIFPGWWTRCVR